ncbi:hypothetical protein JXR01_01475 [Candidatus Kaiserbacteria bacterium]|nr:MAG: hypothetical protein JXR01_01475 [Candidatus Kaiserbacteria bacterium]
MGIDNLSAKHKPLENEELESVSKGFEASIDETADFLFDQYMKQHLLDKFFEDLEDFLDEEHIEDIRAALASYTDSEVVIATAIPHELRERNFQRLHDEIINEKKTPVEAVKHLVEVSNRYGFGVGYHTSPVDIHPKSNGEWNIKATEQDHRDGDIARAYYSSRFRHLYKAKNDGYIYAVRTSPEDKTDGNWSRSSSLSIIMRVPFREVHDYVVQTAQKMKKTAKK